MRSQATTAFVDKFQAIFDADTLRHLGRVSGFCRRERRITADRFLPSMLASLTRRSTTSIAELHRDFNEDHDLAVNYKPYYDRLDTPEFPLLMKELTRRCCSEMRFNIMQSISGGPLASFNDIIIHDGTSFAVRDGLEDELPGRFTEVSPAAVELHVTMSLFTDAFSDIKISPDKECERHFAPQPYSLKDKLLLADRGYDGAPYLKEIADAGGSFLVRIRSNHDPIVLRVCSDTTTWKRQEDGGRQKLSKFLSVASHSRVYDIDVEYAVLNVPFKARALIRWCKKKNEWVRLLTNLQRKLSGKHQVFKIYRLRWQIELLFKTFKSFSSLRKFQTNKFNVAIGLIWAAVLAAFLKRFICHSCQIALYGKNLSTHKMAISGRALESLMRAAALGAKWLEITFGQVVDLARTMSGKSRPERESRQGRLAVGLRLIEFTA